MGPVRVESRCGAATGHGPDAVFFVRDAYPFAAAVTLASG